MTYVFWYPGHDLLLNDIVRGDNAFVWDSRGRKYVDLESGVWCTSIGHGHPAIPRVIAEQHARIAHTGFNYLSPVIEDAASEVLSLLGFEGGKCVFLCSGSEAVEYGVRVARSVLPAAPASAPLFLTMTDSYFGAYGSAARKDPEEWFCLDWGPCRDCSFADDCERRCEHWASIPFDTIGGFLFEPGSSSGLVRFPPVKLVRSLAGAIQERGGLILVNEVTTGVGRTGAWFGFEHYGIKPDIVALGKGVGNGYPVSVTAFAPGVVERLGDSVVKYAQSHQNDPVGAAVAREVIRIIRDEGLVERAREISALLVAGLAGIRERSGRVRDLRARGLMIGLELEDDAETTLTIRTHLGLLRRGYLVGRRPGTSVLRIDPCLTIGRAEIEGFLAALDEALAEPTPNDDCVRGDRGRS